MKTLFQVFMLFVAGLISAQQVVIGRVSVEDDRSVSGVTVYNVASESLTQTDNDGHFLIYANPGEEIRFIKRGFERVSYRVDSQSFAGPLSINLRLLEQQIEEVVIGFSPSGILSKDSRALDRPLRERKLNEDMASYMYKPPTGGAYPSNQMPSTLSMGPEFSKGQMDLMKLASGLATLVKAAKAVPPPSYAQREAFYRRVKQTTDLTYFYSLGLDEYEFDIFLAYADKQLDLTKNYRLAFNSKAIEGQLKGLVKKFLDTRVTVQKEAQPS